jgi:hypothetical protein
MTAQPWPRSVSVAPERLAGWLDGFAGRHGTPAVEVGAGHVQLTSPDGAVANILLPWGPLDATGDPLAALVAAAVRPRLVGALIVRRRAHAVGVFDGATLVSGHHDSHYVQGRTKAGGWSQQRYARRRANQAERSFEAAAADAAALLLPRVGHLEALVTGGDRSAVEAVLTQPGLERLADPALRRGFGVFAVPDPNAHVLAGFADTFRRVRIGVNDLA